MLCQVRSHALDIVIDAHQHTKFVVSEALWFGRMWQCACVRLRWDWLCTKQYQHVHEFIFINNNIVIAWSVKKEDDKITKTVIQTQISDITRHRNLDAASQCVPTTLLGTTTRMIRDVMHNRSNWEYHLRVPKSGTLGRRRSSVTQSFVLFCVIFFPNNR